MLHVFINYKNILVLFYTLRVLVLSSEKLQVCLITRYFEVQGKGTISH